MRAGDYLWEKKVQAEVKVQEGNRIWNYGARRKNGAQTEEAIEIQETTLIILLS